VDSYYQSQWETGAKSTFKNFHSGGELCGLRTTQRKLKVRIFKRVRVQTISELNHFFSTNRNYKLNSKIVIYINLLFIKILLKYLTFNQFNKTKLHGLSPRANYTDRAIAARRRSNCQHPQKDKSFVFAEVLPRCLAVCSVP
jgi:hypothetical protein